MTRKTPRTRAKPFAQIDVESERGSYPVLIGAGLLSKVKALLTEHAGHGSRAVVSCPPVWRLHGARLTSVTGRQPPLLMPDGERAKSLASVARLYGGFDDRGLDRASTVVAFGGGVLGDAAGFAAATYLRGLRLVHVPTTLVAQVDSAIGGKVGVNLQTGKNLVGAFHPPTLVLSDPELLATLPRREFRAGLYEVVKYGVIASRALLDQVANQLTAIFAHDLKAVTPVIVACSRIKAEIVSTDERESGPRRALNFGHTIGHALEAITDYRRFRHGEAVAYGMLAASRLSVARGALAEDDDALLSALIARMGPLPLLTDLRISDALDVIKRDKKVLQGRLHFVLATGLGSTTVTTDVGTRDLTAAMRGLGMTR